MIFTSNYARKGTHPKAIAISRKAPSWYEGKIDLSVAPTWDMILAHKRGEINDLHYTFSYLQLLKKNNFNAQYWVDSLPEDCYLLCFESPDTFCHRRILAVYIEQQTGIVIPEWKNPTEQKEADQCNLVNSMLDF